MHLEMAESSGEDCGEDQRQTRTGRSDTPGDATPGQHEYCSCYATSVAKASIIKHLQRDLDGERFGQRAHDNFVTLRSE